MLKKVFNLAHRSSKRRCRSMPTSVSITKTCGTRSPRRTKTLITLPGRPGFRIGRFGSRSATGPAPAFDLHVLTPPADDLQPAFLYYAYDQCFAGYRLLLVMLVFFYRRSHSPGGGCRGVEAQPRRRYGGRRTS